jgi:ketosteroid isomerase-like protein
MSAEEEILALERVALERWGRGDPDGFLEITAPDVSYFDPFVARRADGAEALTSLYEDIRGKVHIDRFDLVEPRVQLYGDIAILTFQFDSQGSEGNMRWNTTEVYRRTGTDWRIVHSHWAFHQPQIATKSSQEIS